MHAPWTWIYILCGAVCFSVVFLAVRDVNKWYIIYHDGNFKWTGWELSHSACLSFSLSLFLSKSTRSQKKICSEKKSLRLEQKQLNNGPKFPRSLCLFRVFRVRSLFFYFQEKNSSRKGLHSTAYISILNAVLREAATDYLKVVLIHVYGISGLVRGISLVGTSLWMVVYRIVFLKKASSSFLWMDGWRKRERKKEREREMEECTE